MARLGGDEFGVILCDVSDPEEVLRRLRNVIEKEVEVSGLPLSTESSIGYVVIPDDGTDVDELLQRADVALYVAKAQHAGVVRYDTAQDHYNAGNLGLIADLRHAIDNDELVLHYQPKVTLPDGEIDAVEALVRWQHPTHGLLSPDRFVPLAEQTDLIEKMTRMGPAPRPERHEPSGLRALPHRRLGQRLGPQHLSHRIRRQRHRRPAGPRRAGRPAHDRDHRDGPAHGPGACHEGAEPSSPPWGSESASTTSASVRHRSASCRHSPSTS